jgi:hypothetical protein
MNGISMYTPLNLFLVILILFGQQLAVISKNV